jgi:hypothetical protein
MVQSGVVESEVNRSLNKCSYWIPTGAVTFIEPDGAGNGDIGVHSIEGQAAF